MQKFMCVFHIHKKDVKEYSPTTEENLERENGVGKKRERNLLYFVLQTTVKFLKYSLLFSI